MVFSLLALSWSWVVPRSAHAGGLYLMPRGVEASARGGARVAGSDNPNALWYNPAGLISSGKQLLVDATLPIVQTEFTRVLSSGASTPTVSAPNTLIPIPTLAYSDNFGLEDWGFGIGALVPTGYVPNWPSSVDGERAPQRYSVLNTDGSSIASVALGAAYRPAKPISFGATVLLTAASLGAEVAVSACDYAVCSQPEGREWEGRTRFLLGPVYTATAILGTMVDLDMVRIGASAMLPTKIAGEADFDVQLPDQKFFDDVEVENEDGSKDLKADMDVRLPAILRLGVEVLPTQPLKVELGVTYETWSVQDSITVRPKNVVVTNVPGIGTVDAQPVTLARNMENTWAINLGGKYALASMMPKRRPFDVSAGAMFETGAFQDRDLSPTTIDTKKLLLGLGASLQVWDGVMLDVAAGHIFMQNRNVTDSEVLLPAAIKPLPKDDDPKTYDVGDRPAIGNGKYVVEANFVGLGVRWLIDDVARSVVSSEAETSAQDETTDEVDAAVEPVTPAPVTPAPVPAAAAPQPAAPQMATPPGGAPAAQPAQPASPAPAAVPAGPAAQPAAPTTPAPAAPAPGAVQTAAPSRAASTAASSAPASGAAAPATAAPTAPKPTPAAPPAATSPSTPAPVQATPSAPATPAKP